MKKQKNKLKFASNALFTFRNHRTGGRDHHTDPTATLTITTMSIVLTAHQK